MARRPAAEPSVLAACEYSSQVAGPHARRPVTDSVDAAVLADQQADL